MEEHYPEEEIRESQVTLRDYWLVLKKRKWTVVAFALPLFVMVTIYSFVVRPTYAAKGTLLIEKEPNILTFEEVFRIETLMDDYYQTQFKLLQSRSLAENVIGKMKLGQSENFAGKLKEGAGALGTDDPRVQSKLVEKFLKKLDVKPVRQTRLVEVQWKDSDARFAAEVVNALFDSFIDMNIELKTETTEQATEFLAAQIDMLRGEIEEREREMQKYGAEKNIIALSETETTIVETLGELNKALTEAQIDRIRKEAYYNEIKNASPDNIPDAMTNLLIQRLREDYARMSREYTKKGEVFKPDYPEMQRLKTELESAKRLLENETNNLIKTAYSDFQAALKRERSLGGAYNNQKQEAVQLHSNAIPYNSLKIEIENRKSLLESLIKRESETGVAARLRGWRTSNVRIVDRAEPPLRPASPRKKLNMLLALMMGLFGGVGLAFIFEHLDNSVKNHEDVERATGGVATLGIVPAFAQNGFMGGYGRGGLKVRIETKYGAAQRRRKKRAEKNARRRRGGMLDLRWGGQTEEERKKAEIAEAMRKMREAGPEPDEPEAKSIELITYLSPKSNLAESYRTIRTSLLLGSAEEKPKAIVVTSALPEEGKSVTLSNLAVTLAQAGKNVLVLDTDFRKPTQHNIFRIGNVNGLTNYLTSEMELKGLVKATPVPRLFVANVGPLPPNPAELLGSEKMGELIGTMKRWFDFILLDSPPVLTVSDAMVLGPRIDGMILVVWGGKTSKEALKRAKEKLDMLKIKCLGVVINNISIQEHDYYFMYHYYRHYEEGTRSGKTG